MTDQENDIEITIQIFIPALMKLLDLKLTEDQTEALKHSLRLAYEAGWEDGRRDFASQF